MIIGLTEQESAYVENMYQTFETEGWKTLIEDVTKRRDLVKDQLTNTKITLDEIRVAQGRIDMMNELIGLQPFIENYVKAKQETMVEQDE